MTSIRHSRAPAYRAYTRRDIERIPQLRSLSRDERLTMQAVAAVLPFRVNSHVIDELIRWDDVPDDPIFQLTFPQPGMLEHRDLVELKRLLRAGADAAEITQTARAIQRRLNPHPGGQQMLNVPHLDGRPLPGMQHKYRETLLFFPSQGQTCHAYCTYCFRWAQFVGDDELKIASREAETLHAYVARHREVSSILFTGGDPMIMKTRVLRRYVDPLLTPDLGHLASIRIGTKAPAYWPQRFLSDPDADDLLRLFEDVVRSGRHLALMAHFSHPRELEHPAAREALARILRTGAVVRCQAPLIRNVNDTASAWAEMWRLQVRLGAVPYYMFVERDTGARNYFEVPLARALRIYQNACRQVSGLARTARGPVMSATPGKVMVDGVADVAKERVFVLKLLQARNPEWVHRPHFARYDPHATWLTDLEPALDAQEFFYARELREMMHERQTAGDAAASLPRYGPQIAPQPETA